MARHRSCWLVLVASSAALLLGAASARGSTLSHPAPAFAEDFPDPAVAYDPATDRYCAFATASGFLPLQRRCSFDRITWSDPASPFCDGSGCVTPQPGSGWAPAVAYLGGAWRLYWADPNAGAGRKCIRVASADALDGPFQPESAGAIDCHASEGGEIDPFVFVDSSGDPYLLWKMEGDVVGGVSRIVAQRLAADGLSFAPGSAPTELLRGTDTSPWERRQIPPYSDLYVENPALIEHGGLYYLFYSASDWNSSRYATGLAVCDGPTGPCVKQNPSAPWLGPFGAVWGPGGASTFVDETGAPWLAYHTWTAPCQSYTPGCARQLRLQSLVLSGGIAQLRVLPGTLALVDHALPPEPTAGAGQVGWHDLTATLEFDLSSNLPSDARWGMRFQLGGAGDSGRGFVGLDPLTEVGDYGLVGAQSLQRAMLFSIRGATGYSSEYEGRYYNVLCQVSTGPNGGVDCAAGLTWFTGHQYKLRVFEVCCAAQPSDDEWWGASVVDEDAGLEYFIAQIKVPGGWSWIQSHAQFEVAYDGGTVYDCGGILRTSVTIETIAANDGSQAPISRYPVKGGGCPDSVTITPAGDGYTIVAGTASGGSCGIGIELVFLPSLAWLVRETGRRRRARVVS